MTISSPPPRLSVVADEQQPSLETVACAFCDATAVAICPRCGTVFCPEHGDAACDTCSEPASGLPSPLLFRATVATFVVASLVAVWLLIAPPRLPGEHPPPPGSSPRLIPTGAPGRAPAGRATAPAGSTPAAVQQPAPTPAPETYTIKAGDTLGAIALQFGTTVDAIRAANPGINESALQIGQVITLPPKQ